MKQSGVPKQNSLFSIDRDRTTWHHLALRFCQNSLQIVQEKRQTAESGDATLNWMWSTILFHHKMKENNDGPTPLLLLSIRGFYSVVSCCWLLNNSGHEFCNTSHAASAQRMFTCLWTYMDLKSLVALGSFSKADSQLKIIHVINMGISGLMVLGSEYIFQTILTSCLVWNLWQTSWLWCLPFQPPLILDTRSIISHVFRPSWVPVTCGWHW